MHMPVNLVNQRMQADFTIDQTNQNVFTEFDIKVIAVIIQVDTFRVNRQTRQFLIQNITANFQILAAVLLSEPVA